MSLTGEQYKELTEALLSAFPKKSDLEMMLRFQFNENLAAIVGGGTLKEICFRVIQKAEAEGWVLKLVKEARQANKGNPKLKAFEEEILQGDAQQDNAQQDIIQQGDAQQDNAQQDIIQQGDAQQDNAQQGTDLNPKNFDKVTGNKQEYETQGFKQFQKAIVRLQTSGGLVVGGGMLVTEKHVVTCAHVVNAALGLEKDSQDKPTSNIELSFPLVGGDKMLTAKVMFWEAIKEDSRGDVAILELVNALPAGAEFIKLEQQDEPWGQTFRVFGYPRGFDNGVWASGQLLGAVGQGHVQIEDVKTTGKRVEGGFSGNGVWSEEANACIGIAVTADRDRAAKVAFMLPTKYLYEVWSTLQYEEALPAPIPQMLPTVGGAMPPDSPFYIKREADKQIERLVNDIGVTIAIDGPFQVGKSSLLAKMMQQAKKAGKWIVHLDFQRILSDAIVADEELFYKTIFSKISYELKLDNCCDDSNYWPTHKYQSTADKASQYMETYVFEKVRKPIFLAFEETYRVLKSPFKSDFFAMLRSWHDNRATSEDWQRLDIVMVRATSADFLINNPDQSPMNVAEKLVLADFQFTDLQLLRICNLITVQSF